MKVAIIGATGETGTSIVNGLLESTNAQFDITALTRPSSLEKPDIRHLKKKGVKVVAADQSRPEDELAKTLQGIDVVISAVNVANTMAQIPFINAAKAAGVSRFVPCFFASVIPPHGIVRVRELKEQVLNHIKKINLPYTVIDVGVWYQLVLPPLPSGRIDYALIMPIESISGQGNTRIAMTDVEDIGRYVARVIVDDRTLNRMVLAYTDLYTQNQVYDLLEKLSGETIKRKYLSADEIKAAVAEAEAKVQVSEGGLLSPEFYTLTKLQYMQSWGIRGDNTPEHASYLGYVSSKQLYPDVTGKSLLVYCQEALNGTAKSLYKGKSLENVIQKWGNV